MRAALSRHRLSRFALASALALTTAALAPARADQGAAGPSTKSAEASDWVARLDHPDFQTRVAATEKLVALGGSAVAPLAEAAREGAPESIVRAIGALEAIYLGDDLDASSAAEDALDRLAADRRQLAGSRAGAVLVANQEIRRERAIAQIKRLGGIVELHTVPERAGVVTFPDGERTISHIVLGRAWTGGDEGLKYLKRIPDLSVVYLTKGGGFAPLSPQAELELQREMPHVRLQDRGLAFLGIQGEQNFRGGCLVSGVTPDEAADKAGIRPGDTVLEFDGRPVADFQSLIDLIMEKQPGEEVPAIVRRGGQELELTVELGAWSSRRSASRTVDDLEPVPEQSEPEDPRDEAIP
ncbi:MAG: PDZ domain-containing protein [Planctomycetaceae bacterium]